MIGFFVGILIMVLGAAIIENAAFSDRAQFGFWVCLIGAVIMIAGGLDWALS